MTKNEHNGWTNYETWIVKLWIDNEEGSYNYWREEAEHFSQNDNVYGLSKALESEHSEALPELQGFASDLLNAAMSEVNWYEIAQSMIDDYKANHPEQVSEQEAEA